MIVVKEEENRKSEIDSEKEMQVVGTIWGQGPRL